MSAKPIALRALAHADIEQAIDYYLHAANAATAMGFVDVLEAG